MYKVSDVIEAQALGKLAITYFITTDEGVKSEEVFRITASSPVEKSLDFEILATRLEAVIRNHVKSRNKTAKLYKNQKP